MQDKNYHNSIEIDIDANINASGFVENLHIYGKTFLLIVKK
jgi:hypothetical protein